MSNMPTDDGASEAESVGGWSVAMPITSHSDNSAATTTTISEIYPGDSASQQIPRSSDSVASITSSVEGALYKVVGGRVFNSQSDLYLLPADDEEHSRLDMQHFAVGLTLDSLFPFQSEVRHLLRDGQTTPPQIMDIGTGSGRWAVDMALQFPHAEVLGTDLVPPALLNHGNVPKNCRFEVDDANLSMGHHADTFNLVHARFMDYGLNDVESFFNEVARVLKPGGMFIQVCVSAQMLDEHKQPYNFCEPGGEGFCWVQRIIGLAHQAAWNKGGPGSRWKEFFTEILEANPNYSEVKIENAYIPLGPWPEGLNDREAFAANLMRESLARVILIWRETYMKGSHNDQDMVRWADEAVKELRDMSAHSYLRVMFISATRSNNKWKQRGMESALPALESRTAVKGLVFESHL